MQGEATVAPTKPFHIYNPTHAAAIHFTMKRTCNCISYYGVVCRLQKNVAGGVGDYLCSFSLLGSYASQSTEIAFYYTIKFVDQCVHASWVWG